MTTTALKITDESSALELIRKALEGDFESEIVELSFENWPVFSLNVKGDRYNSTVTSGMMRSLLELQRHLYRVYAEVVYGKSARVLTAEEREQLEIVFKVEQGSSNIFADLGGFFTELGKNAMDKMTGKQVVGTVVGISAMFFAASAYDTYTTGKQKTELEQNRHEVITQLIDSNQRFRGILEEQQSTFTDIIKSVIDADQVKLPIATLTKADIENITRQERQVTQLERIDGEYTISSFKKKTDSFRIEITRVSDGVTFGTELFKGHLSMAEMDAITSALTSDRSINLNVVGRVRGEAIVSASIVGVDDRANGIEVDKETIALAPFTPQLGNESSDD